MSSSRNDTRVLCPFYQHDESISKSNIHPIMCEGWIPGSTIALWFEGKKDRDIQVKTFCCEYFDRCEIYGMLMDTKNADDYADQNSS